MLTPAPSRLEAPSRRASWSPRPAPILDAGDWDCDGAADMIVRNRNSGKPWLYRGNGQGQFAAPTALATGFKSVKLLAAVGDMTGDARPDLTGQPAGGSMRTTRAAGSAGSRRPTPPSSRSRPASRCPWVAGTPTAPQSLFRSGKRVSLYPGNGPVGSWGARAPRLNVKRYDWMVGVGDMGVNGHSGDVVREKKTGYLWLLPGTTQGVLRPGLPGAGVQGVRPGRLGPMENRRRSGSCSAPRRRPGPCPHRKWPPRRARESRRPPAAR